MAKRKRVKKKASSGSSRSGTAKPAGKNMAKQMATNKKKRASQAKNIASEAVAELKLGAQSSKTKTGFPVVGIGASAGGLEALEELFGAMPGNTGMAFVVITHQHPGHASLLPALIGRETSVPVTEAADGTRLEPNHVYVGPPGGQLSILNGILYRMDTGMQQAPRLPIDNFFRSLAIDQKERAIGIVLSGTGTDGTIGMKAIKAESGMSMVQQPQSAKYAGMPSSAIAAGMVDYVLPPAEMPRQLLAYVKGPYMIGATAVKEAALPAEPLQKIFIMLRNRTGHDFSSYKRNTLYRRIERRMNVHQAKQLGEYVRYLQGNPGELDILFKELLISVTNFFRDADAWEELSPFIDQLIESRPEDYSLRVWVPGCATGEEAFSLAILFRERMDALNRLLPVQIFGTDLDTDAIETARSGLYPEGIAVDVQPKRLERYFVREDSMYRVRKEIREMTIFAPQNVIKDPPFVKLDLLSCRNLLIYLNSDLQKKLLPIFHYALKPGGLLFLGPSETIGTSGELFDALDKRWKIFRRRESVETAQAMPALPNQWYPQEIPTPATASVSAKQLRLSTQFERLLLHRFAPASVVANERGDILFIHGRTGEYLEPAEGEPRNNVLDMARQGLQIELSSAIRECMKSGTEVKRENIRVKSNDHFAYVNLTVAPIVSPQAVRGLLLLTFRPTPPPPPPRTRTKGTRKKISSGGRMVRLERELRYTKESHQTTLEELETTNEELKSANEELQSVNEELQSTNEELETSKEELQSLNEELTTVNAELQSKVDELSQANVDTLNLLNSTYIATVFLDNELNIRQFTAQAKDLIMLRETDIGRPISELASNLDHSELLSDCHAVLSTLSFREREVRTKADSWYLMRIMPYRTAENMIEGLVLTFVDINRLKRAEQDLAAAKESHGG